MNLTEYFKSTRPHLLAHLKTYIDHKKKDIGHITHAAEHLTELYEFILDSKNLRGLQIMMVHDSLNGTHQNAAFDAALAIEFVHASGLIHDDISDNDLVRHGKPSMYAAHMHHAEKHTFRNPLLYGQSQAIWNGDLGLFLAQELISTAANHANNVRILKQFAVVIQCVCAALMNELELAHSDREPTEQEILNIYLYKTGKYSIVMPLTVGALLAEAEEKTVRIVEQFGNRVGIIFQLKDDDMGLFGDEKTIGKPVGSDIRENKKTLFRALLFHRTSDDEKKQLKAIFGKEHLATKDIETVRDLIDHHKVRSDIQTRMQRYYNEATALLAQLEGQELLKSRLAEFLQMNIDRVR